MVRQWMVLINEAERLESIKHFRVLSWSGVKHPGVDWTVEGSLCSFGREVGGS